MASVGEWRAKAEVLDHESAGPSQRRLFPPHPPESKNERLEKQKIKHSVKRQTGRVPNHQEQWPLVLPTTTSTAEHSSIGTSSTAHQNRSCTENLPLSAWLGSVPLAMGQA